MSRDDVCFGLLRRRECLVPSPRGGLILILALGALSWISFRFIHPFLAMQKPLGGEILVVEGWMPDYALRRALDAFRAGPYSLLLTTGGPLPMGTPFASYGTYAQLAAVTLRGMGLGADSLATAPSPWARKDRTYLEGVAVGKWLDSTGRKEAAMDLFSFATHARRSRLLFAKALGAGGRRVSMGVYSAPDAGYDPAAWWNSSNGVRNVLGESIGYLYARIWFRE